MFAKWFTNAFRFDGGALGGGGTNADSGAGTGTTQTSKVKLAAKFLFNGQPLRSGPDNSFHVVWHAKIADVASVLAQSPKGDWVYVTSTTGDGWTPKSAMQITGEFKSLPVWPNPFKGFMYKPDGVIDRATDLKNGPNNGFETLGGLPANKQFKLVGLSKDKFWAFVWTASGSGWVPLSAVKTQAHVDWLPIWDSTPFKGADFRPKATAKGTQIELRSGPNKSFNVTAKLKAGKETRIIARNDKMDWVYILDEEGDGWVSVSEVTYYADLKHVPLWLNPQRGASQG